LHTPKNLYLLTLIPDKREASSLLPIAITNLPKRYILTLPHTATIIKNTIAILGTNKVELLQNQT
jgi:hypothetical protein